MPSRTSSTTIADRPPTGTGSLGNARRRLRRSACPDVNLAVFADTDTSLKVYSDANKQFDIVARSLTMSTRLSADARALRLCCRIHEIAHRAPGDVHVEGDALHTARTGFDLVETASSLTPATLLTRRVALVLSNRVRQQSVSDVSGAGRKQIGTHRKRSPARCAPGASFGRRTSLGQRPQGLRGSEPTPRAWLLVAERG